MTSLTKGGQEKEQMLPNSIQILSYNESEILKDPPRQDACGWLKIQPSLT